MNIENPSEEVVPVGSVLEKLADNSSLQEKNFDSLNEPIETPYASGFDTEHPMPTFEELKNAGFSDYLANQILNGENHYYSQKELFNVLYSENPVEAYNAMMELKANEVIKKSDDLVDSIQKELGISL